MIKRASQFVLCLFLYCRVNALQFIKPSVDHGRLLLSRKRNPLSLLEQDENVSQVQIACVMSVCASFVSLAVCILMCEHVCHEGSPLENMAI